MQKYLPTGDGQIQMGHREGSGSQRDLVGTKWRILLGDTVTVTPVVDSTGEGSHQKKEAPRAWLARGRPNSAGRHREARRAAATVGLKEVLIHCPAAQEEKAESY